MVETQPYFDDTELAILAINFLVLVTLIPAVFSSVAFDLRIIGACLTIVFFLTVGVKIHKTERRIESDCYNSSASCIKPHN